MKSLAKMFLCCLSVIGMTALFSSCTEEKPDEPGVDFTGSSILVPNETGTYSVTMEFDAPWEVSNKTAWFSVTPLSGNAGTATINVNVIETNPDLREKVASFIINCGGVNTQYYVIQDVTPGFNIANYSLNVGTEEQQAVFTLEGNVDFEALAAEDWVTVDGIESDSTLLPDDVTYSRYKTYRINMSIAANDGEVRYNDINLNGVDGVTKDTVTVAQMGELVADYDKAFFRRTLGFRLTATTCGYCPIMAAAMKNTYEQTSGRFVPFTMYGIMAGTDWMIYENYRYWLNLFQSTGFPTGVINGYADLGNYSETIQTDYYLRLTEEATAKLPANNLIGGQVIYNGTNIDVRISVASKKAGNYTLGVFLMENGIVGSQSGAGSEYEHNFVVKDEFTNNFAGDPITVSANSTQEFSFSIPVPSTVDNIDNCYVCVWIASDGTYQGSISGPNGANIYKDYGILIDNTVTIPLNGFAVFEYEK